MEGTADADGLADGALLAAREAERGRAMTFAADATAPEALSRHVRARGKANW